MNRVFKLTSQRVPRSLARYERDVLEDIIVGLVLPEPEPDTPETVLAAARREAEQKVHEAYAEGMLKGFEAGKSQFDASVAQAGDALQAAAEAVGQARQAFIDSLTPQVLELATAIAARVLQREATIDRDLVLRTVERALEHLANHEHVTVRLNPADLEAVKARRVQLLESIDGITKLTVVADESITPGGCVASSNLMEVDGRIQSQLDAILDALRDVDGSSREE
ncbi:MAG: FliH/SctL family protein [Candidatus Hydrogenedentes bacterium]|nr:FliH/SctL family protein [Candidatus Hydrogenedentota bacterium]